MKDKQYVSWKTIGHKKAKSSFDMAIKNGRLAHAYLITGPEHVGKTSLARDFARKLFCQGSKAKPCGVCEHCKREAHTLTDLLLIDVEEEIKVEQIRHLRSQLQLVPIMGKYRAAIVSNADKMTSEASNALLKLLEEPGPDTVIFLTTSAPYSLPDTIRSRTQVIRCGYSTEEDLDMFLLTNDLLDKKKIFAGLWHGRLGLANMMAYEQGYIDQVRERAELLKEICTLRLSEASQKFSELSELESSELKQLFGWWQLEAEEEFSKKPDAISAKLVRAVERAGQAIDFNANKKLLLDNLMIKITL